MAVDHTDCNVLGVIMNGFEEETEEWLPEAATVAEFQYRHKSDILRAALPSDKSDYETTVSA